MKRLTCRDLLLFTVAALLALNLATTFLGTHPARAAATTQYKVLAINPNLTPEEFIKKVQETLNAQSADGWQFQTAEMGILYFRK